MRCSRPDQNEQRQIDGLAGRCDELHLEKVGATARTRPVFNRVIAGLRPGDTLVVYDLDRAFRSSLDALTYERKLRERGVKFEIVQVSIDTASPEGEFVFTLLSALAQFERQMLSRRTKEGLAAARAQGKRLGRPRKLDEDQIAVARRRVRDKESLEAIATAFNLLPWTVRRSLRRSSEPMPRS